MGFSGVVLGSTTAAQAWWRDRPADDELVIESYPPGYYGRGPYVVYQAPRHWNGPVLYGRRGQPVYVTPDAVDENAYYEDVPPDAIYPDELEPYPRPRATRRGGQEARLPGGGEDGPAVIPGMAPRRSTGPKIITVRPRETVPAARTSIASVAVPVPRPNLEGMDFAPATPGAAITAPARQADEGRR